MALFFNLPYQLITCFTVMAIQLPTTVFNKTKTNPKTKTAHQTSKHNTSTTQTFKR